MAVYELVFGGTDGGFFAMLGRDIELRPGFADLSGRVLGKVVTLFLARPHATIQMPYLPPGVSSHRAAHLQYHSPSALVPPGEATRLGTFGGRVARFRAPKAEIIALTLTRLLRPVPNHQRRRRTSLR